MALKAVKDDETDVVPEKEARAVGRAIDRQALFENLPALNTIIAKMTEECLLRMDKHLDKDETVDTDWITAMCIEIHVIRTLKKRLASASTG